VPVSHACRSQTPAQRVRAEPNVSRDHPPIFVALAARLRVGRRDGRTMSDPVSRIRTAAQLAEYATEIRALSKRAIGSIIEIGGRLIEAKAIAGHGNWLPWLEREFGWGESTALRFMRVAELSKSVKLTDLDIDLSALYRLAAPSTPAEVVEEVVARGREGRVITYESITEATAARRITYEAVTEATPAREVRVHTTIADDRREAEAPTMTGADFHRARIRLTADELLRSLSAIAAALARHQDIGEIVATLTDAERYRFREGIEAVDRLKAALDETDVVRFPKLS
jgi:hypothetical protein